MTDFDKLHERVLRRMEELYPKIAAPNEPAEEFLKTIVEISAQTAIETLTLYEQEISLRPREQ